MTTQPALLRQTFSPELSAQIIAILKRGYRTAREKHDPENGSDALLFGLSVYTFIRHEFIKAALEVDCEIEVSSERPALRLRVGEFVMACHCVGDYAVQDIDACFPNNDCAAPRMIENHLWLPGMGPQVESARKVILAHLGNPETGLEAAYICIPCDEEDGLISEWAYTHQLLGGSGDGTDVDLSSLLGDVAPEEETAEPEIRPKEDGDEEVA